MRKLLVFAAFLAMTVAVAACTGDDDDATSPTPSPSPSPSPSPTAAQYDVTVNTTNWPHAGGGARVLQGTTVVFCTNGTFASGATWTVTAANAVTNAAMAYTVEVYGDVNADGNYDNTDHEWLFTRNANTTTDSVFALDHNATGQSAITWQQNVVCPGT